MLSEQKTAFLFTALLALFLVGCTGLRQPAHEIDYYVLEYDAPEIRQGPLLPFVVRVDNFRVAPAYGTNSILYRQGPHKRNAYVYHKWRANPGDLVTYYLARDLERSRLFQGAFAVKSRISPTHVVQGTVDEFYEYDDADAWRAVLSVSITFMRSVEPDVSRRILFQQQYAAAEDCIEKNPAALAAAMSKAMEGVSGRIIEDIYASLAASP